MYVVLGGIVECGCERIIGCSTDGIIGCSLQWLVLKALVIVI